MIRQFRFSRPVWILFGGTLANRLGMFVLAFLALYMTRRGFSPAQAGLTVACYGGGALVAALVGGHLADRIGRRRAIALSMFSGAIAMLALSRAETFPLILAAAGATGLTAELYRPAASALLVDLVEPAQRVAAFAGYRLAVNLGAAIGPAIGGFLAEQSFGYLFVGDALTCAAFGVIALVWLPEGRGAAPPATYAASAAPVPHAAPVARAASATHAAPVPGRFGDVLRDRPFVMMLIASVLSGTVYAQMTTGLAMHVAHVGLSNAAFGTLVALNGLVVLLIELPIATVTSRLSPRPVIAFGILLLGLGFGATGLFTTFGLLAVTVVVWTLGEIVSAPVSSAYVATLAPPGMIGRYQGAWGSTFALGWVLGPSLGGRLFAWHPAWLWGACAALGLLAAVIVLASGRGAAGRGDSRPSGASVSPVSPTPPTVSPATPAT